MIAELFSGQWKPIWEANSKLYLHGLNGWLSSGGRMGLGSEAGNTPFIHFHYNTPLKPPAHNHTYSLMQGGGGLLRVATIYKNNQRCKSLTIWFMLMWLHFHCCPWVPFFICCAASVAFFVETTFHLQMLKLMNLLCQALSAFSIGKMLKTLYGCHTSCPIRIALPSVSPSRWRYEVLTVLIWVWSPHLPLKLPPLHLICYQNAGAAKQGEKRRRRQGRADREACKRKLQTSVRKQIICNTKLCVLLLEQKDLL